MFIREIAEGVTAIRGIGHAKSESLRSVGVETVSDLLLYYPRSYEDRQTTTLLADSGSSGIANTVVTVLSHEYFGYGRKSTLKIHVEDSSAQATLVCFGRNFLENSLKPGGKYHLYGQFAYRFGELQASVFDTEPYGRNTGNFGSILPTYPLSGQLTQGFFRRVIRSALDAYGESLDNELPEKLRRKHNLLSKPVAIREIHFPTDSSKIIASRRTLCYEELFYLQLAIKRRALKVSLQTRRPREIDGGLADDLLRRLPFPLTRDQHRAIDEIRGDLEAATPMLRLLQGDVGCGKTLVGLVSSLLVLGSNEQVAMMAPTELLARQHAESAAELLEPLGVRVALLSGAVKQEPRRELLRALEAGDIDVIFGTHALFSKDVVYHNLGLVIVDEQHRFGVLQRMAIVERGQRSSTREAPPDLLLMTATPIPRSLALTVFGDLEISTIQTMPPGRKQVATHLARIGNEQKVYDWVRTEVKKGHQAYFVYPLIEQSDLLELKDAESMFDHLKTSVFQGLRLALIHSRLPEEEKRDVMDRFRTGEVDVLVATSVIEVGVNVANATCMVVEHAERFGLSALHQLRGRVGRAEHQSYAFLVYNAEITEDAKNRLLAMKKHNDGFAIAEEDLMIRGPGELTGIHQSGRFKLTIADIVRDLDLLKTARADVEDLLRKDPGFIEAENAVFRKVFDRAPPFSGLTTGGG